MDVLPILNLGKLVKLSCGLVTIEEMHRWSAVSAVHQLHAFLHNLAMSAGVMHDLTGMPSMPSMQAAFLDNLAMSAGIMHDLPGMPSMQAEGRTTLREERGRSCRYHLPQCRTGTAVPGKALRVPQQLFVLWQ